MADRTDTPNNDTPQQRTGPGTRLAWLQHGAASEGAFGARRALWLGRVSVIALTAALLLVAGRVAQLQGAPDERVTELLASHESDQALMARRGALLDRRGRVLAATRVARRLFVDPQLIEQRHTFAERVAYGLGYNPVAISRQLHGAAQRRYLVLDHRMSDPRAAQAEQLEAELPGLATEPVLVRDYPHGKLAGQVIGFVGRDGDGLAGLEHRFEKTLAPKAGQVAHLRDARRRALWLRAGRYESPTPGKPVRLSLDVTIQSIAEAELASAVTRYGASHGELVVMDPHTGEVLAMANFPRFDPGTFSDVPAERRRNRCVTDVFEPGSIFKPFIWAAATQLDEARPQEKIDTTDAGYYVSPEGRPLRDTRGHGTITWNDVLVLSSNIGMAIVGQRLGIERMHMFTEAFGFGRPTGSGLPGEVGGLLRPTGQWNHYSVTSIPMGQEIGVTPLQVTRAFCAFGNDGLLVTPMLRAADQTQAVPIQRRILRSDVAIHTRRVLRRVVTEGTGQRVQSDQYAIFGKTGTAQMPNLEAGGYYQDRYVASFIGGAPMDEPRLIVGCFVHDPDKKKGHYGGTVAGPAVKRVLERSLLYLGVSPDAVRDEGARRVRR